MITAQEVMDWAGITFLAGQDDPAEALGLIIPAVIRYVDSLPNIDRDDVYWAETTKLGAIMLAARLYRRKNSPAGVEAIGDTMSYISRTDSDIDRLLNQNAYRKPMAY